MVGVTTVEVSVTLGVPLAGTPVTSALFVTAALVTSAAVITYGLVVQVNEAPGASVFGVDAPQVMLELPTSGSFNQPAAGRLSVTAPVFFTTKV